MGHIGALPGRFRELLGNDPEVTARLDAKALDACFDLDHYLRGVDALFARAERAEGSALPEATNADAGGHASGLRRAAAGSAGPRKRMRRERARS